MRDSYCSYQSRVDMYWRFCLHSTEREHIREMVDALMAALRTTPDRVFTPWSEATIRAKFEDRLDRARKGTLQPVDEIKSLRGGRDGLYEIRWVDIAVTVRVDGGVRHAKTGARLIHAEPDELGIAMLGLTAHEKPHQSDAKVAQDEHIDQALAVYHRNVDSLWGVSRRT